MVEMAGSIMKTGGKWTQQDLKDILTLCNRSGLNALHIAALHNAVDMAKQLIDVGCQLDAVDTYVRTIVLKASIL